jgi:hypothetical protein
MRTTSDRSGSSVTPPFSERLKAFYDRSEQLTKEFQTTLFLVQTKKSACRTHFQQLSYSVFSSLKTAAIGPK